MAKIDALEGKMEARALVSSGTARDGVYAAVMKSAKAS